MMSAFLRRMFGTPTPRRPDRAQLRSELFTSLDVAINRARAGLSARDIADHLERKMELMRLADSISRPIL
jgi:hypothetical protein